MTPSESWGKFRNHRGKHITDFLILINTYTFLFVCLLYIQNYLHSAQEMLEKARKELIDRNLLNLKILLSRTNGTTRIPYFTIPDHKNEKNERLMRPILIWEIIFLIFNT